MPLGSLTNSLIPSLGGLRGPTHRAQSTPPPAATASAAPVVDVSKDRLDVTPPSAVVAEPALPVAAYAPPVQAPQPPDETLPAVVAPAQAEEPALPAAPADFPAAAAAAALAESASEVPALPLTASEVMASAQVDDASAAPAATTTASTTAASTTTASTGTSVSADVAAPAATGVATGATVQSTSLSSDEDKARAMAIKALAQERQLNMASFLTEAATSNTVVDSQKAAAKASAEASESKRPALLVA